MIASVTADEIVLLRAQTQSYFEFKAQPDQRTVHPGLCLMNGYGTGNGIHSVRATGRARIGAVINILRILMVVMVL